MIGLVIVSHSRPLAQALANLAQQVASNDAKIAIAAGAGPDHQEFGTDAIEILDAIQAVYNPDGVLILMDLGSAVLSAQMAVELLPEEMQGQVHFCSAPLVEGIIAAAVQAGLGSDLDTACQEAQQALLPKREQLGEPVEALPTSGPGEATSLQGGEPPADQICAVLTLHNTYGLHARPAARFVQTAARYDAQIQVRNLTNQKGPVSAKSLNALATLGAVQNSEVELCASGTQAQAAIDALSAMIRGNFGEGTEPPPSIPAAAPQPAASITGALSGVPIAEGFAVAKLAFFSAPPPPIPEGLVDDPVAEWARLQQAFEAVSAGIQAHRIQMTATIGEDQASIFDAHLLILEDPELQEQTRNLIFEQKLNAAAAWNTTIDNTVARFMALDDPYLKQRAADVRDVGTQVLFQLAGRTAGEVVHFDEPVILAAEELTPTQTSQLDLETIQGLATVLGGPTSHSAILARSLGIPAISGIPISVLDLPEGTLAGLDGSQGALWINPDEATSQSLVGKRETWLEERAVLLEQSRQPGSTRDGHRVEIVANAGNLSDAHTAVENGAEGIGLLRTEFLFLTRQQAPDEDEQHQALQEIALVMSGKPVIVRTLDVGGDKPLPYIQLPEEANPFLGVRAIRLSFQQPELFKTQLRAILLAGAESGNLKVMFPMISGYDEVAKAREYLREVHEELTRAGLPHQWPVETGIMVEIPSTAVMASQLASQVDFFSIGTNDLTQYTLAAERGNPNLASLADALHPAVLQLIQQVCTAAHEHGKWVGVCGELAGDPLATGILVGVGVDELSMNPASIPRVKGILRSISLPEAKQHAMQALACNTTSQVRSLAVEFLAQHS
jgi:phosphocarrier protein FPr